MSKDKIIGLIILVGAAILLVFYTLWLVGGWIQDVMDHNDVMYPVVSWIPGIPGLPWTLAVVAPLWIVAVLVLAIAIWIGYSMLTTPPPVPLEELEEELEAEEAAEKKKTEEKKE
jgi:hypothetical protein